MYIHNILCGIKSVKVEKSQFEVEKSQDEICWDLNVLENELDERL